MSQFSMLLDELDAESRRRERPDQVRFRKAQDSDWISSWNAERSTRRDRHRSIDGVLRKLDAIAGDVGTMAKPVSMTSPRETFAKAYSTFTAMVTARQFTAVDASRLEAAFHHKADDMRARGLL
jgi:hypothetical protein